MTGTGHKGIKINNKKQVGKRTQKRESPLNEMLGRRVRAEKTEESKFRQDFREGIIKKQKNLIFSNFSKVILILILGNRLR